MALFGFLSGSSLYRFADPEVCTAPADVPVHECGDILIAWIWF
jgi:hypothetical protein